MYDFKLAQKKSRNVLAVVYEKDGSNRALLESHSLIWSKNNSVNLIVLTPCGSVAAEPGDWIVKDGGDLWVYKPVEYERLFEYPKA